MSITAEASCTITLAAWTINLGGTDNTGFHVQTTCSDDLIDYSTFPDVDDAHQYVGWVVEQIRAGTFPPNEEDA